nr:hypothetical protein [uncultured bacterium]
MSALCSPTSGAETIGVRVFPCWSEKEKVSIGRYAMSIGQDPLVVAVEDLSVVRGRMDAVHSDGSTDAGGDGHGDAGGDGLNIPESS